MARILVVEDDERLKFTYDILLKKENHEVIHAQDGTQALKLCEEYEPDLILLDMRMPVMDGLEFLRKFDLANKHPKVKVIVFSNMEHTEQLEEAYQLGASRYILKASMSPKQLAELIRSTLTDES